MCVCVCVCVCLCVRDGPTLSYDVRVLLLVSLTCVKITDMHESQTSKEITLHKSLYTLLK